jgi:SAM-dependent methyltransferase
VDLHTLVVDRRSRCARVLAADAQGVVAVDLDAAACERVAQAAQPLFDWAHGRVPASSRTPRDATLVAFEVDALARTLRLGYIAERSPLSGPPSAPSGLSPAPSGAPVASSPSGRPSQPGEPTALTWTEADYGTLQVLLREAARTALREVRPRKSEPADLPYDARWEYLYQHGGDGWELARTPPPLARYLTSKLSLSSGQRVLVVGAGRGHEALLLAGAAQAVGAQVIAIDIAPTAVKTVQAAAAQAGLAAVLQAVEIDLFLRTDSGPLAPASYDLIVEHCCFCAIEPSRRDEYVEQIARLLRPGGRFIGLFYCHSYPGGPPFGASIEELQARFAPALVLDYAEVPSDSVLSRVAQEWLIDAHRR